MIPIPNPIPVFCKFNDSDSNDFDSNSVSSDIDYDSNSESRLSYHEFIILAQILIMLMIQFLTPSVKCFFGSQYIQ